MLIIPTHSALQERPLAASPPSCCDCCNSFPECFWSQSLPVLNTFGSLSIKWRGWLGELKAPQPQHLIGFCTQDHHLILFLFKNIYLFFYLSKKLRFLKDIFQKKQIRKKLKHSWYYHPWKLLCASWLYLTVLSVCVCVCVWQKPSHSHFLVTSFLNILISWIFFSTSLNIPLQHNFKCLSRMPCMNVFWFIPRHWGCFCFFSPLL